MKSVIAFSGLAFGIAADIPDYQGMWTKYKHDFSKSYEEGEEQRRFGIFSAHVDRINEENGRGLSHRLGVTQFADLLTAEFTNMYFGYAPELRKHDLQTEPWQALNVTAPASIDWVAKGAVTPVKNQNQCGSCWSFSTTGAVEGAFQIATGKLVSLSEENLVDCDHGDNGCSGGLMDNAFNFIRKNGICAEIAYPYIAGGGTPGQCKSCTAVVAITGYTDVPQGDEIALKLAVARQPVSVAIEADKMVFQLYRGGVLKKRGCGTQLDHGVLVVGYGTDGGDDYWKVKNSWGPTWGEGGYIRLARGQNYCGIATQPSYPTGARAASPDQVLV